MRITQDHLFHGAALNQIADHSKFTAINAFIINRRESRSAFKVNDNIGVYLKYASSPTGRYKEYLFTFNSEHLRDLNRLHGRSERTFISMVCVHDSEICCLPFDMFNELLNERRKLIGKDEDQYSILVTLQKGAAFRVYVNEPGKRKISLEKRKIPRSDFPKKIFEV